MTARIEIECFDPHLEEYKLLIVETGEKSGTVVLQFPSTVNNQVVVRKEELDDAIKRASR